MSIETCSSGPSRSRDRAEREGKPSVTHRTIDGGLLNADKLQQRSCEDLSISYPGDLASSSPANRPNPNPSLGIAADRGRSLTPRSSTASGQGGGAMGPGSGGSMRARRAVPPPLVKRNTIADFANSRAYQASTASLISASEQERKLRSAFSLLKLIDKKSHSRSRDNLLPFSEVLTALKPSEFTDVQLARYKDAHWTEIIFGSEAEILSSLMENVSDYERRRREAVWELFTSQCVFLFDHLMALKHCFMEPLKKVQVEGHLMFAEPQDLFGNLDELCYVTYTFCYDFITLLIKDAATTEFGRTEVLVEGLTRFCQLTRDGEVYHDYCLNYPKAISYLEQLRKNEDFCEFEKWCGQDSRCRRLLLTDLLIAPMQYCTKVPLLLNNICRHTLDPLDKYQLTECLEKLESSLKNLEKKMISLKNFERLQELQQQIVWQSILELEPRTFIPEFLKPALNRQPCSTILANEERMLIYEGPLTLTEVSKTIDMYAFLFNDILLLTRIKKPPRKKSSSLNVADVTAVGSGVGGVTTTATAAVIGQCPPQPTDGAIFVVHRQPIALDRFIVTDVKPRDAIANGLKNAFVIVQISRFSQILGVYTLQAATEAIKMSWLNNLHSAQEKYRERKYQQSDRKRSLSGTLFDDRSSTISGSSTVGSRLTSYYDVAWLSSANQQNSLSSGSVPAPGSVSVGLTTAGTTGLATGTSGTEPAVASGSAQPPSSLSASVSSRQLSPLSPFSACSDGTSTGVTGNRDRLPSSPRSPKSPSSSTVSPPAPVVSISDLSEDPNSNVAMEAIARATGYWNGNGASTARSTQMLCPSASTNSVSFSSSSPTLSRPLPNHRIRSTSSEQDNGSSTSSGVSPVFGRTSNSYLTAPCPLEALPLSDDESQHQETPLSTTQHYQQHSMPRTSSLYSRRRTVLKAIREKSLSIDIDLISATAAVAGATSSATGGATNGE